MIVELTELKDAEAGHLLCGHIVLKISDAQVNPGTKLSPVLKLGEWDVKKKNIKGRPLRDMPRKKGSLT
jgi:hypothetical protein